MKGLHSVALESRFYFLSGAAGIKAPNESSASLKFANIATWNFFLAPPPPPPSLTQVHTRIHTHAHTWIVPSSWLMRFRSSSCIPLYWRVMSRVMSRVPNEPADQDRSIFAEECVCACVQGGGCFIHRTSYSTPDSLFYSDGFRLFKSACADGSRFGRSCVFDKHQCHHGLCCCAYQSRIYDKISCSTNRNVDGDYV